MQDTSHNSIQDSQVGHTPKATGAVIVAVSVFLNFTGFTLILPVIPFLVGQYVPPEQVGLYVGSSSRYSRSVRFAQHPFSERLATVMAAVPSWCCRYLVPRSVT
ncbi:MAG: hypothetical protein ABSE61_21085 [Bradyrhizobium sp.]